jgi:predicted transcriptional regulator
VRRGERVLWVEIPLRLAVKLVVRWARQDAGLTQARLAKLAGVSQPVIAKLEAPDSNPTVETLDRVFSVLKVSPEFGMPRHDHA